MLKNFVMNGNEIPVPVPIKTAQDAWQWIEETFSGKSGAITSFELNGFDLLNCSKKERLKRKLNEKCELQVTVDSPYDIALESLGMIQDLSKGVASKLKKTAVNLFQDGIDVHHGWINELLSDINLIEELIGSIAELLDTEHEDWAPLGGVSRIIKLAINRLNEALNAQDSKKCASVLINRVEPYLKELINECEGLSIKIYANRLSANGFV